MSGTVAEILATLPSSVTLRSYRPGDEADILALYRAVYPGRELAPEEWRWKFTGSPAGESIIVLCHAPDGTLVSHSAAILVAAQIRGERCLFAQSVDAMSHPSFRGAGMGRNGGFIQNARVLQEWVREGGVAFTFGFPSPRHLQLGQRLLRYSPPYPAPRYARVVEALPRHLRPPSEAGPYTIRPVDAFGREADALWEAAKDDYPTALVRDAAYLNWRYRSRPGRRYQPWVLADTDGRWLAWVVATVDRKIGYLVDMLVPRSLPMEPVVALIDAAVGWARNEGAEFCETWMPRFAPARRPLERSGFQRVAESPHQACLTGRSFAPGLGVKDVMDTFYFQMGDSDHI